MKTKKITRGKAHIVYHVMGSGPTICLIASTGRGPGDFHHLANELVNRGFCVILPEPRGIGGSTGPLTEIDFHDLAKDVKYIIEAESDSAIIAGHAYGCWIARTLAADYPDIVRGLVLMAAGAGTWSNDLSKAIDTVSTGTATREDRIEALQLAFFAPGNNPPESWLTGWHTEVIAAQRAARSQTDRAGWWHSGTAPILDLIGTSDPFRPPDHLKDYAKEFGKRLTLHPITDASHALPDEKPVEAAVAIADWAKNSLGINS